MPTLLVPELLLVPLYLGGKAPLGTLWIVSDKEGHFDSGHARVMTELASFVGIALRMLQSEQRLQLALDEQQTLAAEMSHRIKNLFAAGSIETVRLSNGNCRRMGIPKRTNYCTPRESAQGWTPYAPRHRGLRPKAF
jgi:GAF domain-containing protein